MKAELQEIASQFALEGAITAIDSLGEGFINDTFIVRTAGDAPDYILQRKNKSIFPDVPAMMENIRKVTDHIRRRVAAAGGDPRREAMTVVATRDGKLYHVDAQGEYWAVSVFISDTIAYNKADSPELARKGGEGIGKFQAQLADFTEPLAETIKGFHNIRHRFVQWDEALRRDAAGRVKDLAEEIGWIESRRDEMLSFWSKVEDGTIPTRVTHNDTKINNILFDKQGEVLCAIDLDTVMNSTSLNDFGDAIRYGASTAAEDERDLSKVEMSLERFRVFTRGYVRACPNLTARELELLPLGAKTITLECGMRFLTDHIDGDLYFAVHREGQNLDRARAQFRLAADMEKKWDDMRRIVAEETKA